MEKVEECKTVDYAKLKLSEVDNYFLCTEFKKYKPGDKEHQILSDMIFEKNKKLISAVIKKYFNSYLNGKNDIFDELYQQGVCGLMNGLKAYNPDKAALSTFIYPYIVHEMKEYIDKQCKGVTSHYASNQAKINAAIAEFESQGKTYTAIDISQKTGLKPESVSKALRIEQCSNLVYYEDDDFLDAQFSEHFDSPEKQYIEGEKRTAIAQALHRLTHEQEVVIRMKMGFEGSRMSFREISSIMGKTPDELKKIYNDGLRELRGKTELTRMFPDYLKRNKSLLDRNVLAVVPKGYAETEMEMLMTMELPTELPV